MKAPVVLFGGQSLSPYAVKPLIQGCSALSFEIERARSFPNVSEVYLLLQDTFDDEFIPPQCKVIRKSRWTLRDLLETLVEISREQDFLYFAWADCPLLDPSLTSAMVERHLRWAAEYTFADGWPYGFAPEILAPSTAAILLSIYKNSTAHIASQEQQKNSDGTAFGRTAISRDALFQVLQKDINSFDIETEIAPVDLRPYRLTLAADSKRNYLLLQRLINAGLDRAELAPEILEGHPELLRTLPAFYQIQVSRPCPQLCSFCPYPQFGNPRLPASPSEDFMSKSTFESLLDRIVEFSGDAVIDISLWGEAALHPDIKDLMGSVLRRPELALIVETSGIGWISSHIEELAAVVKYDPQPLRGPNKLPPLSWIVSLDARNGERYQEIRGAGFEEAYHFAEILLQHFPGAVYVQAIRVKGSEDDMEQFYRYWKALGAEVIIQKYDYFAGFLPQKRAGDISPLIRQPCWHLQRDMAVLLDGTVPLCKEDVSRTRILGNVFNDSLASIWESAQELYLEQSHKEYSGICKDCDEYYTFNF
ncbi:spiro-SPASM protein [Gracilinema caldarium]|uniref:Radical SAM domain protein n=1 Tax=Gracilinema caldarium (strain ATCC 51460 / DSM 7334 / H1) TaxID=744872 RepID=F8F0S3_GRAC1|nr:spiro-SPASM protein [Gracilinema caldarium]AEJ19780.1 Radical SAM domain protein [Gracilinema caldarium DSM 7334]